MVGGASQLSMRNKLTKASRAVDIGPIVDIDALIKGVEMKKQRNTQGMAERP